MRTTIIAVTALAVFALHGPTTHTHAFPSDPNHIPDCSDVIRYTDQCHIDGQIFTPFDANGDGTIDPGSDIELGS
jgi:hypothetical protein